MKQKVDDLILVFADDIANCVHNILFVLCHLCLNIYLFVCVFYLEKGEKKNVIGKSLQNKRLFQVKF